MDPHDQPDIGTKNSEKDQETDVWWGSYDGRTMIPRFLICALLTLAVALAVWGYWDEERAHPQLMWHAAMGLVFAIWLSPLTRLIYRIVAVNYRLTNQRLFRIRGFRKPTDGEVDLARVTAVKVEASTWERLVGVGRICVASEERAEPLVIDGVHRPHRVAAKIRGFARRARKRNHRVCSLPQPKQLP